MAGKGPSPLLGYNTNLRRRGVLCHVQTEDSGVAHPHVITHVFTAGTIIGTRKRSYKEHVGAEDLESIVRKLMQEQHKAMCIALRDGELDANLPTRDTAKMDAFTYDAASLAVAAAAEPPPVAPSESEAVLEIDLEDDDLEVQRSGTPTPPSPQPAALIVDEAAVTPRVPSRESAPPPPPSVAPPATPVVGKAEATPLVAPPPTRPPPERPHWAAELRETPPPPSMVQSKPRELPADTTYKAKPRETPPPPPRGPSRTPLPATRKRASTVPPAPRPVAVGRRAPTEPPVTSEDGAGRYSSKAPTLFASKRGPTPPPPPPPPKEVRRPKSSPRSSIFGQEYISEKSLDEVILSYLSEEMDEK